MPVLPLAACSAHLPETFVVLDWERNTLLQTDHHEVVETFGWLTHRQFSDLYGLAETAPGPSSMFVSLLGLGAGWKHGMVLGPVHGMLRRDCHFAAIHIGDADCIGLLKSLA